MLYKHSFHLVLLLVLSTLIISACQKNETFSGTAPAFLISQDTLRFDTVFTTIGSATRYIKIYNQESEFISVDIAVSNPNSVFRLNVDGISGNSLEGVEIPPNDSIYVFAEVTINPDEPVSISPFIQEDQVQITSGESSKTLYLEAFGQNANYIIPANGRDTIITCDFGQIIWDDPKPYVVYGIIQYAQCDLIFPAGTRIYVHGGLGFRDDGSSYNDGIIATRQDGRILSQGTKDEPVVIQGDRLEEEFQDIPGQWRGIVLFIESKGNTFRHTIIKNSIVGVQVDSLADVYLDRCQIYNTSSSGILSFHGNSSADNTLIHSNGSYGLRLSYGGTHTYNYCTVASYGNQREAVRLDNYRCTDQLCLGEILVNPAFASFINCAFTGSTTDEISLDDINNGDNPEAFSYQFRNCLVRVDDLLDAEAFPNFFDRCENCLNYQSNDPLFASVDELNFRPDTLSVLEMKALPIGISIDIEDQPRDFTMPDIGCYEYAF